MSMPPSHPLAGGSSTSSPLAAIETKLENTRAGSRKLLEHLTDLNSKCQKLLVDHKAVKVHVNQIDQAHMILTARVNNHIDDFNLFDEEFQNHVSAYEGEVARINKQLDDVVNEQVQMQEHVVSLETENAELTLANSILRDDMGRLLKRIEVLEAANLENRRQIDAAVHGADSVREMHFNGLDRLSNETFARFKRALSELDPRVIMGTGSYHHSFFQRAADIVLFVAIGAQINPAAYQMQIVLEDDRQVTVNAADPSGQLFVQGRSRISPPAGPTASGSSLYPAGSTTYGSSTVPATGPPAPASSSTVPRQTARPPSPPDNDSSESETDSDDEDSQPLAVTRMTGVVAAVPSPDTPPSADPPAPSQASSFAFDGIDNDGLLDLFFDEK